MSSVQSGYAELHCISHFTFLRGASAPEELVARAASLGYAALALTDECSVAGVVRAHMAAREHGIQLIIGSEFRLQDGLQLVVLAASRQGYRALCEFITRGRRLAPKGEYRLTRTDLANGLPGCLALLPEAGQLATADISWLQQCFPDRLWLAAALFSDGEQAEKIHIYNDLANKTSCPVVAVGGVRMHVRGRRALQDTLTAIRLGVTVERAGLALQANGERYLRSREVLASVYPADWLAASVQLAAQANFSLDELEYHYPRELVPTGMTATAWLAKLTAEGLHWRWPEGVPESVQLQIRHELTLIAELGYEAYFLTVHDIVRFARERGILCQGRGSAANSAVCYCLGITEVDPARMHMLFARFMSRERDEPPDIDIDFEHERREEVIQYIYAKYGRSRAALTAAVITYRPRSAIRDVGKALGLSMLQVNRMARSMQWWDGTDIRRERVMEAGLDPDSPLLRRLLWLVRQLLGFPRHLSQHVGGFLISEEPLTELVPVENTAMAGRTVIQWDKNDLDNLGLLKVDVLALGMLSVIRRSFELISGWYGRRLSMAAVPAEDPQVYAMISAADTVGVFQIESRAQMAMLPRLRPQCFYDLVIEVALIRPGPIQGGMVHPYLRRRNGEEPVTYPSDEVRGVLERTLGVPVFQEQVMELAIVAAGFSGGEADQLRRAMAAWKRRGGLEPFEERLVQGMRERGYAPEFAAQIFRQIKGFGEYGFPESHAASFALLVYVSAWLKCHEPAIFCCALLNSQPMGFYAPAQLVQMAQRQGVEVRSVDVNYSQYECALERGASGQPALRLGFNQVRGLASAAAHRLVEVRANQPFADMNEFSARTGLHSRDYAVLAAADALAGIAGNRYRACWQVAGIETAMPLLRPLSFTEGEPLLHMPDAMESVREDYASTGISLRAHPLALIRSRLVPPCVRACDLWSLKDSVPVRVIGLVITRQRPGNAANVTFVTLEDETGFINLVVWERVAEQQRAALLNSAVLMVSGRIQKQDGVMHVIVNRMQNRDDLIKGLLPASRDC